LGPTIKKSTESAASRRFFSSYSMVVKRPEMSSNDREVAAEWQQRTGSGRFSTCSQHKGTSVAAVIKKTALELEVASAWHAFLQRHSHATRNNVDVQLEVAGG
jgi:hypothetical protein